MNADALFSNSQLKVKKFGSSIEKFPFLVLARDTIMLHKLSIFRSIICQVVAYRRLKTKENFNLLHVALKVVAVTYERW